ncbi:hypothetical protein ACFY05_32075 [Microtetraspora fusca]|uniref:PD-(D/E)XK nuclease family protein n=1 Tax=Microtetraspora fusca TaxID=1997 RepID=A0ABW6VIB6_MICFU
MSLPINAARTVIESGYQPTPGGTPCMCGAPLTEHAGAKGGGGNKDTGCKRYAPHPAYKLAEQVLAARPRFRDDVKRYLDEINRREQATSGTGVRPSDSGRCRRAVQYRLNPPLDLVRDPVDTSAADLGTAFHHLGRLADAHFYKWVQHELPVAIPGLDAIGHIDRYDQILAIVGDRKSAGAYAWEHIGIYGPRIEHWKQAAVYGYGMRATGRPVDWIEIDYISRVDGDNEVFTEPYDEDFARSALGELQALSAAIELGVDLPRDGRGPDRDPICDRCPFRSHCWNIPAAKAAGRSPQGYTILGPDPDAAKIEWAASLTWEWKENRKEAVREYEATAPLVAGLPDGTYGKWVITERRRRMPDHKAYFLAVAKARQQWETSPPALRGEFQTWLDKIELPFRVDVWTEVRPVRVAKQTAMEAAA